MELFEKTIAAISTPAGAGGIGIVRISGAEAFPLLKRVFQPAGNAEMASHMLRYGKICDPANGRVLDRAMAVYMAAPHSYTGEEAAELQCHGGAKLLAEVLALLIREGASPAGPGEFTLRAFLNGKMDLTQAEAVADVIAAKTDLSLEMAQAQLGGAMSAKFAALEQKLLDLIASLEVGIDFPDDEDALAPSVAEQVLYELETEIKDLLNGAKQGRIYREGLRCVLLGEVNAGKSTLFNALLGEERAIVTEIAGTTRDTIEEFCELDGMPLLLIDTAGLRGTEDKIEAIGIERSRKSAASAQLVLILADGSRPLGEEARQLFDRYAGNILAAKPSVAEGIASACTEGCTFPEGSAFPQSAEEVAAIAVLTKADLPCCPETLAFFEERHISPCFVSAAQGTGIEELKTLICRSCVGTDKPRGRLFANMRHEKALRETLVFLSEARQALADGMSIDVLGVDLMNAYQKLGEITGKTAGEEVLNNIFSKFCLGK